MIFRRAALALAVLLLAGAGCDPTATVSLRSPFEFGGRSELLAAYRLETGVGTRLTVRPSVFGVSGAIDDLLGQDAGVKDVTVAEYGADRAVLDWQERAVPDHAAASGTIEASGRAGAKAAFPPALWKPGRSAVSGAELLWLSPAAYGELESASATEWRLAAAGGGLDAINRALTSFERLAARLSLSTSSTSPFVIRKVSDVPAFPLRVDGQLESVAAIRVSGWLADYVILKNPQSPLILTMTVRPSAYGALAALKVLGLDPAALGYEITEVRTK